MENISAILFSQHFEEDGYKQEAEFKIFQSIDRKKVTGTLIFPESICIQIFWIFV